MRSTAPPTGVGSSNFENSQAPAESAASTESSKVESLRQKIMNLCELVQSMRKHEDIKATFEGGMESILEDIKEMSMIYSALSENVMKPMVALSKSLQAHSKSLQRKGLEDIKAIFGGGMESISEEIKENSMMFSALSETKMKSLQALSKSLQALSKSLQCKGHEDIKATFEGGMESILEEIKDSLMMFSALSENLMKHMVALIKSLKALSSKINDVIFLFNNIAVERNSTPTGQHPKGQESKCLESVPLPVQPKRQGKRKRAKETQS